MTRPLRIEYSNAWYHVMNRGLRREDIFFTREDRISFLSLMNDIFEKYHVQTHAYCLMSNHYHLLLNTPLPNLNKAMRHLAGIYTQRFNRAHHRDGPLFRGRYKSKIVESEHYLTKLGRYIHLNPVAAKMVLLPEEYEWSSYQAYMRKTAQPKWLFCRETLSYFGIEHNQSVLDFYREFIHEGVDDETQKLMTAKRGQPILGSEDFKTEMANMLQKSTPFEVPDQKPLIQILQPSLTTIQKIVQRYFNVDDTVIASPGRKSGNLARQTAIYLAAKHTGHSHQTIANFFGKTSRYGVARSCYLLNRELNSDSELANMIRAIENILLRDY